MREFRQIFTSLSHSRPAVRQIAFVETPHIERVFVGNVLSGDFDTSSGTESSGAPDGRRAVQLSTASLGP